LFADDIKMKRLEMYFRSEALPDYTKYREKSLMKLVGSNFKERALRRDKNALILFIDSKDMKGNFQNSLSF